MHILSIDPGVEKVGYAYFKKELKNYQYLTSGLIKTPKTEEHTKRLHQIYTVLQDLIKNIKPDLIVIERLFFFKNQKTVISVGQAQGVILLLAAQENISLTYLTPLQIKSIITGYGNADKKSVQKMLGLLMKEKLPKCEDDQSDAIACGLAYCYLNQNVLQ
jgi:crossover junction endodeoxyribonuclease RuvC